MSSIITVLFALISYDLPNAWLTIGVITLTFLDKFPNFDIVEVNESPDYLVDKLYDDRNTRKLAEIFNKIRELLVKGDVDGAMQLYTTSSEAVVKAKHIEAVDILRNRAGKV